MKHHRLRDTPDGRERQCGKCEDWKPETTEHFHRKGDRFQHNCKRCNCTVVCNTQRRIRDHRRQALDFARAIAAKARSPWEALEAITSRWGHA